VSEEGFIKRTRRSAAQWRALLARFEQSTLSAAVFCRREGICTASLYRWRRLLSGTETQAVRERDGHEVAFVDLGALSGGHRLELKLDLGGGVLLHLVRS